MRHAYTEHIQEVVRVAVGEHTSRDDVIHQSWQRCIDEHRLDPVVRRDPQIVTDALLRERRDLLDDFLHTARFGLETLYRQIAGIGYVILLTDAKGITVDFIGDPTFNNQLQKAGLYMGADWNESSMGTCAVGTCLATGDPLTVHQTDHFDATHIPLTCTASPIYDSTGNLAAVLDISALRSPQPKQSQHLALQLVTSYAHKIETANMLSKFRHECIVKLSASFEFADIDPDYVLAVDGSGRIVAFNDRARRLLLSEARLRGEITQVLGSMFSRFFDCGIDELPQFSHAGSASRRTMQLLSSGAVLFGQSLLPPARISSSPALNDPVVPAALRDLCSGDPLMQNVAVRASKLVNTQMSILIRGETGTGKEHLARAIHTASSRAAKPFVAVNCAALPEALIESELFGHEPGAFTGASAKGKKGLILEAHGGTLFLDEIGDMPLTSQTRLLRVLAEREVTPVGRTSPVPVNIRVLAATHRDLIALVKANRFRDDLYFRLNAAILSLPPLRDRNDLDWLIHRLLSDRPDQEGRRHALTAAAHAALHSYGWPGNVRELVNCLDFACAVSISGVIDIGDLPDTVGGMSSPSELPASIAASETAPFSDPLNPGAALLDQLKVEHWNISAVARNLGVDRSTVHRQMKRYGILPPRWQI